MVRIVLSKWLYRKQVKASHSLRICADVSGFRKSRQVLSALPIFFRCNEAVDEGLIIFPKSSLLTGVPMSSF